jgi:hypothetical protein
MFYVYEHWRTDRDECFYVGKGKNKRAYNMKNRNPHHKAIQNKVIREGFAIEVRIVASGLTENEAFQLEIERIAFWRSYNIDLTNMTAGGDGVSGLPAHNRKSVICLEDGQIFLSCEDAAKKYGLSGISVSDVCRGKYRSVNDLHFSFINGPIKTIREIEDFHAKRRKQVERPENLYNDIVNGKDVLGRSAAGPIKNSKKVICLEDNLEYVSASAAARHYNISKSAIIELCLGKNNRKTASGLKFKYVENV